MLIWKNKYNNNENGNGKMRMMMLVVMIMMVIWFRQRNQLTSTGRVRLLAYCPFPLNLFWLSTLAKID